MESIGFIGLGNLGLPFARNIRRAGYPMVVHDVREGATKPLLDDGARLGASPEEVAQQTQVIFSSLPGPKEVEEVAIGPHGLLEGIKAGAVYIDMSTSRPALIRRIESMFRQKGAHVLDAPVYAGPHTAARRQVKIMPSGDREVFDRVRPIIESFTETVLYTGRLGNGSICKLVGNMTQVTFNQMLAEMLTLGVKAGVELPVLMEASGNGLIGKMYKRLASSVFSGVFEPALFRLDLMRKDIALATELGRELDVALPLANFSEQLTIQAVNRGWGDRDVFATILLQEEAAGVELRSPELAEPWPSDPGRYPPRDRAAQA